MSMMYGIYICVQEFVRNSLCTLFWHYDSNQDKMSYHKHSSDKVMSIQEKRGLSHVIMTSIMIMHTHLAEYFVQKGGIG